MVLSPTFSYKFFANFSKTLTKLFEITTKKQNPHCFVEKMKTFARRKYQ
jgi:hypothetical protein